MNSKTNEARRIMQDESVTVAVDGISLEGIINKPKDAQGFVVFAHGSGSSRHSPRNLFVAQTLNRGGLGTLLFDLLTEEEEEVDQRTRELRFDIDLLTDRVVGAIDWLEEQPYAQELRLGLFGSSTGAAAALNAAAERPEVVYAVVSRGGRVDLAEGSLQDVGAFSLFIVGERDEKVLDINMEAMQKMLAHCDIEIVPGAGHQFEKPGTLEKAAESARGWFQRYLAAVE